MAINRRYFLKLGLLPLTLTSKSIWAASQKALLFNCYSNDANQHFIGCLDESGQMLWSQVLPARGHGIEVLDYLGQVVVFARRPGSFMCVMDANTGEVIHKIESVESRHFYGHGVLSEQSQLLYVTENDYEGEQGIVAVYDTKNGFQRLSEFQSGGVGPHELKLLSDQTTLVVANGGILTHPDFPRAKLNLPDMAPNLAYIDTNGGTLLRTFELEDQYHRLSIRHIDINPQDTIAIAMQYEGPRKDLPPVVAIQQGSEAIRLCEMPGDLKTRVKNYAGSVAFTADNQFSVSSPRGNVITHWNTAGEFLGHSEQNDVCGLASMSNVLWASDGTGALHAYSGPESSQKKHEHQHIHWDNHLKAFYV